jgi:hypothetical protein
VLIDIQEGCNGAVDGPAALADEEQAKGYPKSDAVANRRWVLLVHGKCGAPTLNVMHRTRQRRRLPRRQAFAILGSARRRGSPNGQALARAYKTFASFTSFATIASRGLSTRRFRAHSAVRLIKTNNSGKRKTSSPLKDVVAISSPLFQKRSGTL